jgi:aspartate carbamoyltransferase catalytic subunit
MMNTAQLPSLHNLLDLSSITTELLAALFTQADTFSSALNNKENINPSLANKLIVSLFFEPSTRTQYSFEIAATKLGATVITPNPDNLSLLKGESLLDTLSAFEAMGADLFIIRHADNFSSEFFSTELSSTSQIINAGDGSHHHPTQTLTDFYTISQIHNDISALSYAIIGDIAHSRVANSFINGLQIVGAKDIRLIAPKNLLPPKLPDNTCHFDSLEEGLQDVDVIVCLRIQKERLNESEKINTDNFFNHYAITEKTIQYAKPSAILLHPGPINRGIEVDASIPLSSQSLITRQVQNSVPVKMALLEAMLIA